MDKDFKTLKLNQITQSILQVSLNRPDSRNAINSEMMHDFRHFWQNIVLESQLRCIILTGEGAAFCAGADLKERKDLDIPTWQNQHVVFEQAMLAMVDCPIPIITAVNGAAFGGGLELLLASDFAYAAEDATFAQSEVKLGLMPGALGTQNLPRACGLKRAKELTFTGEIFSAQEAFSWGIINKLCQRETLLADVITTAKKISDNAPLAVRQAKKSLNISQQLDIKSGFLYEIEAYHRLLTTKDREEGIKAFNEKRKPVFSGE